MKVAVAVHGRFHGFDLAVELHRHDMLAKLYSTYPTMAARRFLPPELPLSTAPLLEAARRLHPRLRLPGSPDLWIARRFAAFAARALVPCDVAVGWSGASLEIIPAARALGARFVLERGSTHIDHQSEALAEAHAQFGLTWRATDPRLAERERAEYEAADCIALGSQAALDSFVARGISQAKLTVNPYGVDLNRFRAASSPPPGLPRVLFAGQVGIRKGIPWLLQAFARIETPAELHLVGPVEPGMEQIFARLPMDRVVVRGPVPGPMMPAEFSAASVFCLPSIEEGFGMVILQAMAAGRPVVATTATGLPDLLRQGDEGVVVPPAHAVALAESLERLLADADLRLRMGRAARNRVEHGFSWRDYGERAISAYSRLLDGNGGVHGLKCPSLNRDAHD